MHVADIPLTEIKGHRCAWRGCRAAVPFMQELPTDWRWLMLWWAPAGVSPLDHRVRPDRDAVLCPLHADMLHNEVLEDIGQRLDQTKGSA